MFVTNSVHYTHSSFYASRHEIQEWIVRFRRNSSSRAEVLIEKKLFAFNLPELVQLISESIYFSLMRDLVYF